MCAKNNKILILNRIPILILYDKILSLLFTLRRKFTLIRFSREPASIKDLPRLNG